MQRLCHVTMQQWHFGREVCGDFNVAQAREWIVTNGRGSYACGTVAGNLTRRYHGLLIAALTPPVERRLIVAKSEVSVMYGGRRYALATNRWASGAVEPCGYRLCESFALEDGVPTWTYACADASIVQTIAMVHDRDVTALGLHVKRAQAPLQFELRVLVADRDHHGGTLPEPHTFAVTCAEGAATVALPACGRTLHVTAAGATFRELHEAYRGFDLAREAERDLQAVDDYACVLQLAFELEPDARGGCVFALDGAASDPPQAIVTAARRRHQAVVDAQASPLIGRLAAAADAFIVRRGIDEDAGKTVIAGYPWFADWGRDTMIALPGLVLRTGRPELAREILLTFARSIDGGMLPNRFPDDGSVAEYNTVDAALWFIEAVRSYIAETGDLEFLRTLLPALDAIVDGYVNGTRYGIRVDGDGLVQAGVPGVQLTWMDAKVGDSVITPRIGKPVEISALWYAALRAMETLGPAAGSSAKRYRTLAERCARGLQRFWNAERGYCFDVLDGPGGDDPALRPNQLFAIALHASAFDATQARSIVDVCARELLTSHGLRTLAPGDPAYCGRYTGSVAARDRAYHQGTVWPWLIGPFVRAHLRVYGDPVRARSFVAPLVDALGGYGIGTLPEIFDGDPPHAPRGAVAQAWSIAELITSLVEIEAVEGRTPAPVV